MSQVVQTAWAVLCLVSAQYPDREPIERALKLIMSRQLDDGSWAQEDIEGIFVSGQRKGWRCDGRHALTFVPMSYRTRTARYVTLLWLSKREMRR
jgi:hypothetical protein